MSLQLHRPDERGVLKPEPGAPFLGRKIRLKQLLKISGRETLSVVRDLGHDEVAQAALLSEDERVAAQVRRQYKHFVVDEFQDVSPIQAALLDLWLGGRDEICVVGDPAQTIYSFAGASPSYLLDFPRVFPEATVVRLVRDGIEHRDDLAVDVDRPDRHVDVQSAALDPAGEDAAEHVLGHAELDRLAQELDARLAVDAGGAFEDLDGDELVGGVEDLAAMSATDR